MGEEGAAAVTRARRGQSVKNVRIQDLTVSRRIIRGYVDPAEREAGAKPCS